MSISPLEDLNAAIEANNPFNRNLCVGTRDVWSRELPDLPSLHAHVSNAVIDAVDEVRSGQRQAIGITLNAEKGQGKTHLIARIRQRLKERGDVLFVYMTEYDDLDRIREELLNTLTNSFKQSGAQEVTQWQELATTFVNDVLDKDYSPQHLVSKFSEILKEKPDVIDELMDKILEVMPEIDENPDLIRAILWTLSPKYAPHAAKWIGGRALSERAADVFGLPANPEIDAFERICQLLDLISVHHILVICFDSLDNLTVSDSGLTTAQCVTDLGADLYNTIERGVILTTMYSETWIHQIKALPDAEFVIDRLGEKVFVLNGLDPDETVELIGHYLQKFYTDQRLIPPHPVYPFEERALRVISQERPTPRQILKWCQENWNMP